MDILRLPEFPFRRELPAFFSFLLRYTSRKVFRFFVFLAILVVKAGETLEETKNLVVKGLLWRRGVLTQPAIHFGMVGLTSLVLVGSGFWGSQATFGNYSNLISQETVSFDSPLNIETVISEKPRDEIITYTVEPGDTLTSISEKFAVSIDTIRWANNLQSIHDIYPKDELKILPVSGVAHKVKSGETIYSVAKKYGVDAQAVLNFPFNDIDETLSLKIDQVLIVPDGVMPQETLWAPPVRYAAPIPTVVASGEFAWPLRGGISQYPRWYHMAVDITGDIGTPIVAAKNGVVLQTNAGNWGYGNHVIVDHGGGISTLYAHLSGFNVSPGDVVSAGSTVIGWVGMTGRTSGPHVHFEVRENGIPQNPLSYLK